MKLLKQLFDEGATFAKGIVEDSANLVKGVAQVCEPYARDVAEYVAQAWEDIVESDLDDEAEMSQKEAQNSDRQDQHHTSAQEADVEMPKTANYQPSPEQTAMADEFVMNSAENVDRAAEKGATSETCPDCDLTAEQTAPDCSLQKPKVMVNVNVQTVLDASIEKPVSISVDVQELTDEGPQGEMETDADTGKTSQRQPLRRYRPVSDWAQGVDGIRSSPVKNRAQWFADSTQTVLGRKDLDRVIAHVDFCYYMEVEAPEQAGPAFMVESSQRQLYWALRKKCDEEGIEYNKKDIPETDAEYLVANKALKRLLKENKIKF